MRARPTARPCALDLHPIAANVTSVIRNPDETGDWVVSTEAARILGMALDDLFELLDCERLPSLQSTDGATRFRRSDVERLRKMWARGDSDECLEAVLAP